MKQSIFLLFTFLVFATSCSKNIKDYTFEEYLNSPQYEINKNIRTEFNKSEQSAFFDAVKRFKTKEIPDSLKSKKLSEIINLEFKYRWSLVEPKHLYSKTIDIIWSKLQKPFETKFPRFTINNSDSLIIDINSDTTEAYVYMKYLAKDSVGSYYRDDISLNFKMTAKQWVLID